MDGFAYQFGGCRSFLQFDVGRARDVDERAMSTLDALFQQRRADGDFGGLGGAVLAPCGTDAEQRRAGTAQNGVDIVEVDMNVRVGGDQIGDALHTCQECGVGGLEGVDDADRAVGQLKQSIVGNHDQRIDLLAQILDA